MYELKYIIDKTHKFIKVSNENEFVCGVNNVLSNKDTDVTFGQSWYSDGYFIFDFLTNSEFENLYTGITKTIKSIIEATLNKQLHNFTLEKYHNFVKDDKTHLKVVTKTRDLFSDDFNFPILEMIPKFEKVLGFNITNTNPQTNTKSHIIIRINRPNSFDYNPPHKDMYEAYDGSSNNGVGYFPKFLNFWIPVAGVNQKSSLPIVPKSHLIPENLIIRTSNGAILGGGSYRVKMIKKWNNSNELIRTNVTYNQMLVFSSHLIHGLAINENNDTTRVALEFRLYKK